MYRFIQHCKVQHPTNPRHFTDPSSAVGGSRAHRMQIPDVHAARQTDIAKSFPLSRNNFTARCGHAISTAPIGCSSQGPDVTCSKERLLHGRYQVSFVPRMAPMAAANERACARIDCARQIGR
jgi:hypothetical protein